MCRPGPPIRRPHRCLSSRRVRARGLQHRCLFMCRPGPPTRRPHRCLSSRRVRARGLQHRCPFMCRPGPPTRRPHRCLSSRRVRARGLQHRCPFTCRPGPPTRRPHRCLSSRRVRARGLQHRCPFMCRPGPPPRKDSGPRRFSQFRWQTAIAFIADAGAHFSPSESIRQKVAKKRVSCLPCFAFLCDLLLNTFQSGHSSQKVAKNRKEAVRQWAVRR